jgi:hypothetical protein
VSSQISEQPSMPRSRSQLESLAAQRALEELRKREAARRHLIPFVEYTNPDYQTAAVHRAIADKLEAAVRGEIKRLIICLPPSSGKSELFSRRLPAWFLGQRPRDRILTWSYNGDLATAFGRDVRNIIASAKYRALFPDVALSDDSKAKDEWHTSAGGGYASFGMDGGATGRHGRLLLIDDPFKNRAEAESPVRRDTVWNAYRSVIYTRRIDLRNTVIVVGCTRWHEDDLVGRLDAAEAEGTGDRWERVIYPALTPSGESFCEERFPLKELERIRSVIGPYDWASLYEQRPRPLGGSFFAESTMLENGLPIAMPQPVDIVYAVIDTAVKTGKEHDGAGVTYFSRSKLIQPPLAILDWDLKQIEGADLLVWLATIFKYLEDLAKETRARMGVAGVWIEDKASGMVLLQQAKKDPRYGNLVHPLDSKLTAMGKTERAINCSPYVHAGQVKLTRRAYERVSTYKGHTKNHLLSQVLGFRPGSGDQGEDDLLDTFSYGVALALGNQKGF